MNNSFTTIGTYLESSPIDDFTFDDSSNARLFVSQYRSVLRWQEDAGRWLVWSGTHWESDSNGLVMILAKSFARSLYDLVHKFGGSFEEFAAARNHARRSNSLPRIKAFLELAKSDISITSAVLDQQPYLLNTLSGTVNLLTGELLKHDPANYLTKICPFNYSADAECPKWLNFLETVLPDAAVREYIQKAIGYSLTAAVSERAVFVCYGDGRNGKSVFLDTISRLLGDYSRNTTVDSLMRKQRGSIPNDIARLKGVRFVTAAETDEGGQLDESLIKSLSGGDRVTARYLFGEYFDFYFEGKIWLATNHKPVIKDQSNGMWDRIKVIPFAVSIPREQAVDKDELMNSLLGEAPGILAWAVRGCVALKQEGRLITPPAIERAVKQYRYEQDTIAQFLAERTERGARYRTENSELFNAYCKYCRANNESELSKRVFSQTLKSKGFTQTHQSKRYWKDIKLKD